jgi:hypothetical protein
MIYVMILGQPYKGVSSEWSPNDTKTYHSTRREKMIYISRNPQNVPSACLPSHDTHTPASQTSQMFFLHQIGFYWEFSLPVKCPQLALSEKQRILQSLNLQFGWASIALDLPALTRSSSLRCKRIRQEDKAEATEDRDGDSLVTPCW